MVLVENEIGSCLWHLLYVCIHTDITHVSIISATYTCHIHCIDQNKLVNITLRLLLQYQSTPVRVVCTFMVTVLTGTTYNANKLSE